MSFWRLVSILNKFHIFVSQISIVLLLLIWNMFKGNAQQQTCSTVVLSAGNWISVFTLSFRDFFFFFLLLKLFPQKNPINFATFKRTLLQIWKSPYRCLCSHKNNALKLAKSLFTNTQKQNTLKSSQLFSKNTNFTGE